jgi:hypothetical protein
LQYQVTLSWRTKHTKHVLCNVHFRRLRAGQSDTNLRCSHRHRATVTRERPTAGTWRWAASCHAAVMLSSQRTSILGCRRLSNEKGQAIARNKRLSLFTVYEQHETMGRETFLLLVGVRGTVHKPTIRTRADCDRLAPVQKAAMQTNRRVGRNRNSWRLEDLSFS